MTTNTSHRHRSRARRAGALALTLAAVLAACAPTPPSAPTPPRPSLVELKRSEYGARALDQARLVQAGRAQPVLEFTVENTPPSIFVNYVVPDDQAEQFAAEVDLPPGFELTKVRILDSDPEPRYWLSLNVYRVSGLTTGLRAEWSTYVDDGSGNPRFMIVRARAAEGSVDPLGPLALPEPFRHSIDAEGVIRTEMRRTVDRGAGPVLTREDLFRSTIELPAPADRQIVVPTREWVAANDYIYWLNGVNDRTFHNATAHSAPLLSVDLDDVTVADDTEWAPFVDPVPGHVLVYLDRIEFMIGPWWNVTEPDGRVDPATRRNLLALKRQMYGGLLTLGALAVQTGTGEPIVQSRIEANGSTATNEPSVRWHWRLDADQLDEFADAAGLPANLTLSPVSLTAGESPAHWLTLHVHRRSGDDPGLRAEWITYANDGTAVREVVLDASSDEPWLSPVDRFATPAPLAHTLTGGQVTTTVGAGPNAFTSTFTLPDRATATTQVPARPWVAASDLRYWADPNRSDWVGDRVYAETTVLDPKLLVDPAAATVSDGGRWSAFTADGPDRIWVDPTGTDRVINPWWTLPPR